MNNQVTRHREKVASVLSGNTFSHQINAAQRAFCHFDNGSRAVVIAAEMQSGKSGIALALSCLQRNSLSDSDLCDRRKLKDTLYLVTMADLALLEQAKSDFAACPNMVVSNFTNFRLTLASEFKHQQPRLIIIDECHYGTHQDGVRYSDVFNYLDSENSACKIAFISATPFSALYAAGADSILKHQYHTQLVFHKTSSDYHGIRSMHKHHQIVKLDPTQRDFCQDSLLRRRFIRQFLEHQGPGWSLVRVQSGAAASVKAILLEQGIAEDQIFIIGQKLAGVEEHEISSIHDFKYAYDGASLFEDKLIAITVAGFRAGINFGSKMKKELINSWDSTISNIAAIVQANIGRACGYHNNTKAIHYTNLDAIGAYSELLDHLESQSEHCDFSALHAQFEHICQRYDVTGFDRGLTISCSVEHSVKTTIQQDQFIYLTERYRIVPAKLHEIEPDFSGYKLDNDELEAIRLIRDEYLKDGGPFIKSGRALRGGHQNWIKAQWVNGATYNDFTDSCAKARTLSFIRTIDQDEPLVFNQVVNPGGGESIDSKRLMATIFSVYNLSRQQSAYKRTMDEDDLIELSASLEIDYDDTIIVLFKRGEIQDASDGNKNSNITESRTTNQSIFR